MNALEHTAAGERANVAAPVWDLHEAYCRALGAALAARGRKEIADAFDEADRIQSRILAGVERRAG